MQHAVQPHQSLYKNNTQLPEQTKIVITTLPFSHNTRDKIIIDHLLSNTCRTQHTLLVQLHHLYTHTHTVTVNGSRVEISLKKQEGQEQWETIGKFNPTHLNLYPKNNRGEMIFINTINVHMHTVLHGEFLFQNITPSIISPF